jgi:hypothetical protein
MHSAVQELLDLLTAGNFNVNLEEVAKELNVEGGSHQMPQVA